MKEQLMSFWEGEATETTSRYNESIMEAKEERQDQIILVGSH